MRQRYALADVERQPGISIVIIELIRGLMGSFVNIRQGTRKVLLKTEERDEWRIVEEGSSWPKDDSWMQAGLGAAGRGRGAAQRVYNAPPTPILRAESWNSPISTN